MPFPFMGAALAAIAPEFAKRGLDLLSGIFRGEGDQGTDRVSGWIKEKLRMEDTKNAREAQSGRDKDEGPFIRCFTYIYAFVI